MPSYWPASFVISHNAIRYSRNPDAACGLPSQEHGCVLKSGNTGMGMPSDKPVLRWFQEFKAGHPNAKYARIAGLGSGWQIVDKDCPDARASNSVRSWEGARLGVLWMYLRAAAAQSEQVTALLSPWITVYRAAPGMGGWITTASNVRLCATCLEGWGCQDSHRPLSEEDRWLRGGISFFMRQLIY